jgi:hypothetical protein
MGSQNEHYARRTNAKHLGVVLCDGCDNGGWKLGLGVGSWELGVGDHLKGKRDWERERSESKMGARATSKEYAGVTENSL